jgi:hypothetical protein
MTDYDLAGDTMPDPTYVDTERFTGLRETILATLNALAASPSCGTSDASVRDYRTNNWYEAHLDILGENNDVGIIFSVEIQRHGMVTISKSVELPKLNYRERTVLWSEAVSALTQSVLASHIVDAVIGQPTIPPASRRQARDVWDAGSRDALTHYRQGMAVLIHRGFPPEFGMYDDADQWEVIISARAKVGRYDQHMGMHRSLGIPFTVMDIYDDAYHEAAGALIDTIYHPFPMED